MEPAIRIELMTSPHVRGALIGANDRNRTDDLLITSELLYQLSYVGLINLYKCLRLFPAFRPQPQSDKCSH